MAVEIDRSKHEPRGAATGYDGWVFIGVLFAMFLLATLLSTVAPWA